jgi:hypothetical protein
MVHARIGQMKIIYDPADPSAAIFIVVRSLTKQGRNTIVEANRFLMARRTVVL